MEQEMEQKVVTVKNNKDGELQSLLDEGWKVKSTTSSSEGYSASKTCCWGCLFLPLALLGKKPDSKEYVLEKPISNS